MSTQHQHQCVRCMHCGKRGGTIIAARVACDVLADLPLPHAAVLVLERAAQEQAVRGHCPNFAPLTNHPDAYRSKDLCDEN